jgi:WD40 repeat protein
MYTQECRQCNYFSEKTTIDLIEEPSVGLRSGSNNCSRALTPPRGPVYASWPAYRSKTRKKRAPPDSIDTEQWRKKGRRESHGDASSPLLQPKEQQVEMPSSPIIPEAVLAALVAPFLPDRQTFNHLGRTSREIYEVCKSLPAPWPQQRRQVDSVVQSVAFSPCGTLLACSHEDTICLWNRQSGSSRILTTPTKVTCVAFSPDGRYLASGHRSSTHTDDDNDYVVKDSNDQGSIVCLWDCLSSSSEEQKEEQEDLQCTRVLRGPSYGGLLSVAFSPDGQTIASGGVDQSIRLWKVSDGTCITTLVGHSNWVYHVKFSPDGRYLASVGEDETAVWLWDLNDDYSCTTLEGHSECVHCVDFTPDGKYLVSGSDDETIRLWNMHNNYSCSVLQGNHCSVWTLACSPDCQTIVSGSREADGDRVLRLWSIPEERSTCVLRGHSDYITSVAFSPSGRALASGALDCSMRTWNLATETKTISN